MATAVLKPASDQVPPPSRPPESLIGKDLLQAFLDAPSSYSAEDFQRLTDACQFVMASFSRTLEGTVTPANRRLEFLGRFFVALNEWSVTLDIMSERDNFRKSIITSLLEGKCGTHLQLFLIGQLRNLGTNPGEIEELITECERYPKSHISSDTIRTFYSDELGLSPGIVMDGEQNP